MITAERVYEVFNLTQNQVNNVGTAKLSLVASSPELLVALINYVIGTNGLPPLTAIAGALSEEYIQAIKAIESADSKGRKWIELLEELNKKYLKNL